MDQLFQTGAGRLPYESAPKNAPTPTAGGKTSPAEPFSSFPCTGADALFAAVFLLLGWLYAGMIFTARDIGFAVPAFTCCYITAVEGYARSLRLAAGKESRFWLAVTGLCGISFLWSGEWIGQFFTVYPDRWDLFGWKFLALTAAAVYWTLCRMGTLCRARTGNTLFFDLLRGFWVLPFSNFAALPVCLRRRSRTADKGIFAGVLLAIPLTLWAAGQLAAADERFAAFFAGLADRLELRLSFWTCFRLIFALLVALYLFGLAYGAARKRSAAWPAPEKLESWSCAARLLQPVTVCIALGAVCVVYLLFILLQANTLFSGLLGTLPQSFTHAEYARRGFFELCRVAAVNLSLCAGTALCCRQKPAQNTAVRRLLFLLCLLTLLLILSAAGRMALYIAAYGFTGKRLLTSFFLFFLFFVFLAVMAALRRPVPVVRFAAFLLAAGFVALCLSGPEYWMPRYNAAFAHPGQEMAQVEVAP